MQDLVHIQARETGTDWSAGDTISFGPALSLSLIALGTCVARLGGCYLPTERRWSQQGICFISTVLSLFLVGVVSSEAYSNKGFSNIYFGLFFLNCVSSGLFEAEFMWHILIKIQPGIQRSIQGVGILLCLVVLGLSSWALTMSDQVLLAATIFLAIMCLFYVGACGGYAHLLFRFKTTDISVRIIFQAGCASCFLLFISTGILLVMSSVGLCSEDLGLWVLLAASSIITVRFPVWIWWRKFHKPLFGCSGQDHWPTSTAQFLSPVRRGNQGGSDTAGEGSCSGELNDSQQDLERQSSTCRLTGS